MPSDLAGRRVFVTGAGGFIGSHLAERLTQLGAHTRALVRYQSTGTFGWLEASPLKGDMEIIQGDVRDPGLVRRQMRDIDLVFHLAALIGVPYSYHAPLSYVHTNVEGTANILEAARDLGVSRFVQTSTSEVYGTAQYVPIDEQHPLQGPSPNRPSTIATQALEGNRVIVGNLNPRRDLTFVEDAVDAFVAVAEADGAVGRVINVGSGRDISVGELVGKICGIIGVDVPVISDETRVRPRGSEVEHLRADATVAHQVLHWTPAHSLDAGLGITVEWIRGNIDRYRAGTYAV